MTCSKLYHRQMFRYFFSQEGRKGGRFWGYLTDGPGAIVRAERAVGRWPWWSCCEGLHDPGTSQARLWRGR